MPKVPRPGYSLLVQRHAAWDNSQDGTAGFQKTPVQRALCEHLWPGPQLCPGSVQNQCWKARQAEWALTSGRQEAWSSPWGLQ